MIDIINKEIITENLESLYKNRRSTLYILPSIDHLVLKTAQNIDCWIAGGAALALFSGDIKNIKDWDLFFKTPSLLASAKSKFKQLGFVETTTSDWSISLEKSGVVVQLITRYFYNTISDIFNKFDFTICCFAIEGKNIYYMKSALLDFENKEFNFIYTENLSTCMKRIARYGAKGFSPSSRFAVDIADAFNKSPKSKISFKTAKGCS